MIFIRPLLPLCLLLPSLFLISSTFLPPSHGDSQQKILQNQHSQRMKNENHALLRGNGRLVLEEKKDGVGNDKTLILAAKRTLRRDPLENFNYYNGGWDYRNVHYFSSVSFSAAPLFIIAIVWFLLLGLFLLFYCLCCCCCRKTSYGYSRTAYAFSLLLLILFTFAAFTGCVVLYTNQENFNRSVTYTLEYIVKRGISIFENFMNIFNALVSSKEVTLSHLSLPASVRSEIDLVDKMIETTAKIPQIQSLANSKSIQRVLNPARLALNILAAVMLTLAFLGFLFSVFGLQLLVYILVIIGWILVTLTFILCGVFLIFRNVVTDTCVAMDDWLQNPTADSALSLQFLPCMDNSTAQRTLHISKETTSNLINIVNKYIEDVANKDFPPAAQLLYHNQSGPLVPILCNPFNPDMTDRKCAAAELHFNNVAQQWKKYVCEASPSGICTTTGRLTPNMYDQLTASVNISYSLYRSGPFLVNLADCNFVLETFSDINKYHCPSLRQYSYRTYVGLVAVSASVMCSLIFWVVYARERRHRKYTRKLDDRYRGHNHVSAMKTFG